jgi:N-methylhydantoinase B
MAAAKRAQERLLEMFARFGKETTLAALDADQVDTAKMVREKSREIIPQGSFSVRDYMDHAGVSDRWYSYHVKLTREGDRITLDATASDDQADGSINFLASDGALAAYFGQYFHQYDTSLLSNHGLVSAVDDVQLRQGSILQPDWPAALGCRAHTFTKLKSSVRALLAEATDGKVMAGSAVYVIAYWRMKDSETNSWLLCTDGIAVGHGARPFADGLDAIYSRHNENYPGEFMEMEYPLRMERYAISMDSGGPGKLRGGCGIIRDVRILADEGTFGLRVENNIFPTWGVNGGMGGGTSRVVINPGTPQEKEIRAFSDDNIWKKGDLVRVYTAGGGGWGDPFERETDHVLNDVLDGFVSVAAALESYGVVIDSNTLVIDERATTAKRRELGASRGPTKLFHRFEYFDTAEEELEWVEKNIPR